jgi:hypothetical protein
MNTEAADVAANAREQSRPAPNITGEIKRTTMRHVVKMIIETWPALAASALLTVPDQLGERFQNGSGPWCCATSHRDMRRARRPPGQLERQLVSLRGIG